jgi:hypothetical protein
MSIGFLSHFTYKKLSLKKRAKKFVDFQKMRILHGQVCENAAALIRAEAIDYLLSFNYEKKVAKAG